MDEEEEQVEEEEVEEKEEVRGEGDERVLIKIQLNESVCVEPSAGLTQTAAHNKTDIAT